MDDAAGETLLSDLAIGDGKGVGSDVSAMELFCDHACCRKLPALFNTPLMPVYMKSSGLIESIAR